MRSGRNRHVARLFRSARDSVIALALLALAGSATAIATASPVRAQAQENGPVGRTSGLPVPRFVSLKADKVNVRSGPSKDQGVAWVFTRAGLPVEITAEFETWRRIRDSEGAEGWVYHSMLSSRRTAVVGPWLKDSAVALHAKADTDSGLKAKVEPGVLGSIKDCDGHWCRFFGDGFDGFIEQEKLWGVYPNEKFE